MDRYENSVEDCCGAGSSLDVWGAASDVLHIATEQARIQTLAEKIAKLDGRPHVIRRLLGISKDKAKQIWVDVHGERAPAGSPVSRLKDLCTKLEASEPYRAQMAQIIDAFEELRRSGLERVAALIDGYEFYQARTNKPLINFEGAVYYLLQHDPSLSEGAATNDHVKVTSHSRKLANKIAYGMEIARLSGRPPLMRKTLGLYRSVCLKIYHDVHGRVPPSGRNKCTLPKFTKASRTQATLFAKAAWILSQNKRVGQMDAFLDAYKYLLRHYPKPTIDLDTGWLILRAMTAPVDDDQSVMLVRCRHCSSHTLVKGLEVTDCLSCGRPLSLRQQSAAKRLSRQVHHA